MPAKTETHDRMDLFWDRLVDTDGNYRRAYPRVRMDTPITIVTGDQEVLARMHDIGRGGLQVRCARSVGANLAPTDARGGRIPVQIRTMLRDGDKERRLEARCALVHMTLLDSESASRSDDDDDVALGFCFLELDQAARQSLEWFILRALEPA